MNLRLSVSHQAADPAFAERVRDSFSRQGMMRHIGATLACIEPGICEIELPFRDELSQQHGFFHAGMVSTIADTAGGYAAFSLFPADSSILTVEFKINLLAPADGEKLRAVGRVIKSGRTLTICELQAFAIKGGQEKLCAHGIGTLIRLQEKSDQRPG